MKAEQGGICFHTYETGSPGPRLAIMGGVHGNEVCGQKALQQLVADIDAGALRLARGSLLIIPAANPEATARNVRFIDDNLNRVFMQVPEPVSYEQKLAQTLTGLLAGCDALLDLHSIHTKGWPFVMNFGFFSQEEEIFIAALGLPYAVSGWEEAYADSLPGINRGQNSHTAGFMRRQGRIAAGVECGQHDDPDSVTVAATTIRRALAHFGFIGQSDLSYPAARHVKIQRVFMRGSPDDRLARDFAHGDALDPGDLLAIRADGSNITAEAAGLILFPRPACPAGEEWFYIGSTLSR